MSTELALVDTNVLVYAFDPEFQYGTASRRLVEGAQQEDAGLCVAPQVLAEFFSVVTRPGPSSRTPVEAIDAITQLLGLPGVTLLPVPVSVVAIWTGLVRRHPVSGGDVFDVQLVATMLGNNVRRIYTYNRADFERFEEIQVLTPEPR